MTPQKSTLGVKIFLFLVFLIGIGLNTYVILDAEVLHWFIGKNANLRSVELQEARKSILFVMSKNCYANDCVGTGFIIKEGYVATNAHVATCGGESACDEIVLKDYKGIEHPARLEAIKSGDGDIDDLAILSIDDTSLPPLKLADSDEYKTKHDGDQILTIGYPWPDSGASSSDKAAFSAIGNISIFNTQSGLIISQGMNLMSGNSGGPVFLLQTKEVLGLTVSIITDGKINGGENIIPINSLKDFFQQSVGEF